MTYLELAQWRERAHNWVTGAIAAGRLVKAATKACVDCGDQAMGYDHRDYRMPDKIDPVCYSCNAKRGPDEVTKEYRDLHSELHPHTGAFKANGWIK